MKAVYVIIGKLTTSSTKLNVVSGKVVDVGLGKHRVVFELGLAKRRSVSSNDDELGLSSSKRFQGALISEDDLSTFLRISIRYCEYESTRNFKGHVLFMTRARRELMPSADFLVFFVGAILNIRPRSCLLVVGRISVRYE